jgi:hypothetical protein
MSYVVNDKARRYDGTDYEKVMLSTFLAVNHILLGDWSAARIEIKKTHEREAVIAEFRSKEIDKVEEERKKKGVKTTYKELKGYPVETLNDPVVVNLKNGYQNAFSHYFAGMSMRPWESRVLRLRVPEGHRAPARHKVP